MAAAKSSFGPGEPPMGDSYVDLTEPPQMKAKREFCGMRLQHKIQKGHIITSYIAGVTAIGFTAAANVLQPYLLSNFLLIGSREQGQVAATARVCGEIATIMTAPLIGTLSNRIGRRGVYTGGLALAGLGFFLLPFSETRTQMFAFTTLNTVGYATACIMMITLPGDYVSNADRGKMNGYISITNGIGMTFFGGCIGKLPGLLSSTPLSSPDGRREGAISYWVVAFLALATATLTVFGLAPAETQASATTKPSSSKKLKGSVWDVCPGIVLACVVNLVSGSAAQVAALFIPQWCESYLLRDIEVEWALTSRDKLPEAQAAVANQMGLAQGSSYMGLIGLATLMAAPIFGRMVDTRDRLAVLFFSLLLVAAAYLMMALNENPYDRTMYLACFLLGGSQTGVIVANHAFVQQQTSSESRGTVLGFFFMCGALGQVVNAFLCGQLFSRWRMQGPFWLLSFGTFAVAILCLAMYRFIKSPPSKEGARTVPKPSAGAKLRSDDSDSLS